MKAIIKVVTAEKEFTQDQEQIMRRISNVLREHGLSVAITPKRKSKERLELREAKIFNIHTNIA
ncbi:MAG: hypothetical protein ABSF81_13435 [Bacteroidales bacterium]